MIGVFHQKYHIAIFSDDTALTKKILDKLKEWFKNNVIVETYSDPFKMLSDLNTSKAKNCPFDMTILSEDNDNSYSAGILLKHVNPSMMVVNYENDKKLKTDALKLTNR
jgi:hypothetical protein